jgi:hypothetical protein
VAVNGQHRDGKGSESRKALVPAEYTVRVSKHRGRETSMGASDVCPGVTSAGHGTNQLPHKNSRPVRCQCRVSRPIRCI